MYVVLMIYNIKLTLTTPTNSTTEVTFKGEVIIYNILPYDNNLYHTPLITYTISIVSYVTCS